MSAGLRIGLTVVGGDTDAAAALWSYGIGQNVAYLAFVFQRLPEVAEVVLVSGPPGGPNILGEMFGLRVVQLEDALDHLDVIIEVGSRALYPDQAQRLRKHGGKLVSYMAGNSVVMNFEALASKSERGDVPILGGFDAVWITPQHWKMCRGHASIVRSNLVEEAPHVWSPYCMVTAALKRGGIPFWRPSGEKGARIGVFEPTVNTIKTFHLPLLVAEEAYRAEPDLIRNVLLFNTFRLKEDKHTQQFIAATDLGRDRKVFMETRHEIGRMLGVNIDVVVSHQWENKLNYLYWDILYMGWALVHNCEEFAHVGYYYPSFDPQAGGEVLREAIKSHPTRRLEQRQDVAELLWSFNPDNPVVQDAHSRLLENVMGSSL